MLSNSVNGVKSQRRAKPRLSGRCRGLTATIRTCNDEDEDKVQRAHQKNHVFPPPVIISGGGFLI